MSICRYLLLNVDNPKESIKKIPQQLEVINYYSKVAGYNISQKNQLCFYTIVVNKINNKIKKTIPFTLMSEG